MEKIERKKVMEQIRDIIHSNISNDTIIEEMNTYLFSDDYLIRSKTFILLQDSKIHLMKEQLLNIIKGDYDREWQLRALSVLVNYNDSRVVTLLDPLLYQHSKPLLARGVLNTICLIGGSDGMKSYIKYLLSPYGSYMKDEILHDGYCQLVQTLSAKNVWHDALVGNSMLCYYDAQFTRMGEGSGNISPYPFQDYLIKKARLSGVADKDFKKLFYR